MWSSCYYAQNGFGYANSQKEKKKILCEKQKNIFCNYILLNNEFELILNTAGGTFTSQMTLRYSTQQQQYIFWKFNRLYLNVFSDLTYKDCWNHYCNFSQK